MSYYAPRILPGEQTILFFASIAGFYGLSAAMLLPPMLPIMYGYVSNSSKHMVNQHLYREALVASLGLSFDPYLLQYWFSLLFSIAALVTILASILSSLFSFDLDDSFSDKRYV